MLPGSFREPGWASWRSAAWDWGTAGSNRGHNFQVTCGLSSGPPTQLGRDYHQSRPQISAHHKKLAHASIVTVVVKHSQTSNPKP